MPPELPAIARLLPESVRLRVFEPAYHDMLASLAASGRARPGSVRLLVRASLLAMDSARVTLPRLAWRAIRTSRRFQVAIAVVVVVIIGLLIRSSLISDVPQRY